jgi:hypothetical protein
MLQLPEHGALPFFLGQAGLEQLIHHPGLDFLAFGHAIMDKIMESGRAF